MSPEWVEPITHILKTVDLGMQIGLVMLILLFTGGVVRFFVD